MGKGGRASQSRNVGSKATPAPGRRQDRAGRTWACPGFAGRFNGWSPVGLFMLRTPLLLFFAVLGSAGGSARERSGIRPVDLRCDGMANPLGVDFRPPRLSWAPEGPGRGARQTGWQVLAASSAGRLHENRGDLWDSGRVDSDRQIGVGYAGQPLHSAEQVFWKVRVWDQAGRPSAWSRAGSWTMGLLGPKAWAATWITDPGMLRRVRPNLGLLGRQRGEQ